MESVWGGGSLDGPSHICREPAYKRKGFAHPGLCSEAIRIPNVHYPTILEKEGGNVARDAARTSFGSVPRDIARLRYSRPGPFSCQMGVLASSAGGAAGSGSNFRRRPAGRNLGSLRARMPGASVPVRFRFRPYGRAKSRRRGKPKLDVVDVGVNGGSVRQLPPVNTHRLCPGGGRRSSAVGLVGATFPGSLMCWAPEAK